MNYKTQLATNIFIEKICQRKIKLLGFYPSIHVINRIESEMYHLNSVDFDYGYFDFDCSIYENYDVIRFESETKKLHVDICLIDDCSEKYYFIDFVDTIDTKKIDEIIDWCVTDMHDTNDVRYFQIPYNILLDLDVDKDVYTQLNLPDKWTSAYHLIDRYELKLPVIKFD